MEIVAGTSRMWITYSRRIVSAAGKGPPKNRNVTHDPTTGIDSDIE